MLDGVGKLIRPELLVSASFGEGIFESDGLESGWLFGWLAFWLGQGWFGNFLIGIGQYLSGLFESESISRSGRVVGALFGSEALVSWSRGLYFLNFFVN